MSTVRVGSNKRYAEGWDKIFSGAKKSSAKPAPKKAAAKKASSPKKTGAKKAKK
jgi:hypothetical protein